MKEWRSLTPSNSRPGTPPFTSSKKSSQSLAQSPPSKAVSVSSPPKRSTYSRPASAWDIAHEEEEHDDDDDDAERYLYNENADEDEFGLPSITTIQREARKRIDSNKIVDPGGGLQIGGGGVTSTLPMGRARANSSDIALEREPLSYPSTKNSEGKILRPQYKDILRGIY